jgi:phage replication O-like protein O
MASPQKENGYTPIANELLEAIFKARFKGQEYSVLLWIARNSYGWKSKTTKPTSVGKMVADLDAPRSSVFWALKRLLKAGVVLQDTHGCFSINKDYDVWQFVQPVRQKGQENLSNPLDKSVQPVRLGCLTGETGVSNRLDWYKEKEITDKEITEKEMKANRVPPSLDSITAYCTERNNNVDPQLWHDHYTAKGWLIGKSRMKDWKAAVRTWERNGVNNKQSAAAAKAAAEDAYGRSVTAYVKAEREKEGIF